MGILLGVLLEKRRNTWGNCKLAVFGHVQEASRLVHFGMGKCGCEERSRHHYGMYKEEKGHASSIPKLARGGLEVLRFIRERHSGAM